MMKLLTPANGSVVDTVPEMIRKYIASPESFPTQKVDWLNLVVTQKDCSYPDPIVFSYTPETDGEIVLSCRADGTERVIAAKEGRAEVFNLPIGETYDWFARAGGETSERFTFSTDPRAPRMLLIDGISNVRDFGGFQTRDGKTVKQGLLYRTSEMDTHVEITERGKADYLALGVRTDLDIRGIKDEYRAPALDEARVRWINIPLAAYEFIFTDEQKQRYGETFEVLTDPANYPVITHCWGGIDRTGTLLFLLGGILGISEDTLCLDYELSSFSRWSRRSRSSDQFKAFLTGLHAYGEDVYDACVGYWHDCGITDEQMAQFRAIMMGE